MTTELTTTRANEMIDPVMHVWGWEIPIYLFLGGMVAGMMMISAWFLFSGRRGRTDCVGFLLPGLSLLLLSLGMGALFLDLEYKTHVWRLYTAFMVRSPMSWGAWILIAVYPALFANLLLRVPDRLRRWRPDLGALSDRLEENQRLVRTVATANMVLGILLGVYTGILLSTLGARPLWSSALLGPLFLVSGLSSAAAFVHLVARNRDEREMLARADNRFLLAEIVVVVLFLVGLATTTHVHMRAVQLFFGGPFTAVFWVGVVALGIVIPLGIQSLAVRHRIRHTPIAPLLVMGGGVLLRFVIVNAGQVSHWSPL